MQVSFNHVIHTRCWIASFGGLCLMHTPRNIDIAKYQTHTAALPILLHYWDIIVPMSTIVLPHTPFMCSRHKPASSSMISFHLRHKPNRSRFNPPPPPPPQLHDRHKGATNVKRGMAPGHSIVKVRTLFSLVFCCCCCCGCCLFLLFYMLFSFVVVVMRGLLLLLLLFGFCCCCCSCCC